MPRTSPKLTAPQTAAALDEWLKLRETLGWKPRSGKTELSDEQIAALKVALPKLLETAATGPLAAIAEVAQADAKGQKNRAGAVAALREAALGRELGKLTLQDVAGKTITEETLAGKVVVLHFWEYRDVPLEEPYGQTGYLDYLFRRRGEDGVLVLWRHGRRPDRGRTAKSNRGCFRPQAEGVHEPQLPDPGRRRRAA